MMATVWDPRQLTLGEMIEALEKVIGSDEDGGRDWHVDFAHLGARVAGLCSWRGVYTDLALIPTFGDGYHEELDAAQLLGVLRDAVGATFEGWKGGDFLMSEATPLWVSREGESSRSAVVGITGGPWRIANASGGRVEIQTEVVEI